jgi:hypothetical protein
MILHGPENIAGVAGQMAAGQRSLGLDARAICHVQGRINFDADYRYGARGQTGGRAVRDTLLDLFARAEIYHVYFGRSFLGDQLFDARLAAMMRKRVFYTFLGCDIRDKTKRLAMPSLSMCSECHPHGCSANRALALRTALAGKEPIFVSTPDLLDELPKAVYLPLPVRHDTRETVPKLAGQDFGPSRPLRVLHAPTDSGKKGTRHVVAALEVLSGRGVPIELVQPELVGQEELFEIAKTCHVAVDQVMAGVYGTFAAEMMALGIPVIARIDPRYRSKYPSDLPIISSGPDELGSVFQSLVDGQLDLQDIAHKSAVYAQREHDYVAVARRLTEYY